MYGVITITSSVSFRWNRLERNKVPSTGTSPRPGTLSTPVRLVFWSKPAIAKDCPLPSSTVVSARLTDSAGMRRPLTSMAPVSDNSLTSGRTFMLMRLPESTVGTKSRLTPNFLNSIEISSSLWATGIGNSPPARKLAASPESATRLGSASTETRPSVARASMTTLISALLERYPNGRVAEPLSPRRIVPAAVMASRPVAMPSVKAPMLNRLSQLKPSSLVTVRDTSATRTRRLTCVPTAMPRRLTTVCSLPR